ncbi:MAG: glutamine synthetase family protein [Bacteroidia bacterium]|nr:glutamine synthetase family protein [Bacteroidia bacterium]
MTEKQILDYIDSYPGNKIKLAITDMDGILRGKIIHREKFLSALKTGFGFCDVVFGWDSADVAYDNAQFTGWHTGYPDAQARIDLTTFRKVPWDNDIPFFLADFVNAEGYPLPVCPRSLLKKIRKQSLEMGYEPVFSQEFEWFNFEETPQSLHEKEFRQPQPMTPGMFGYSVLRSSLKNAFFNDLFDLMGQFDVPIEGLHTETGPGVYEAAILYGDILTAADRAVLFKTGTKEIANRHGLVATFMAKWRQDLPGCSGHIHQSLWDKSKEKNLFYDAADPFHMSELMKSYVAGQLYCLPHILPMYAPTINSYKRLVEGAWAPTTITWGMDNRTTALRILTGGEKSARLETRVCGSDSNPYLAQAAALASGLYGIRHNLKLNQPGVVGNGYEEYRYGVLPRNLSEATQAMKNSEIAGELLGEAFWDHFVRTREWEWREFSKAVTDWEMKRYFEII